MAMRTGRSVIPRRARRLQKRAAVLREKATVARAKGRSIRAARLERRAGIKAARAGVVFARKRGYRYKKSPSGKTHRVYKGRKQKWDPLYQGWTNVTTRRRKPKEPDISAEEIVSKVIDKMLPLLIGVAK